MMEQDNCFNYFYKIFLFLFLFSIFYSILFFIYKTKQTQYIWTFLLSSQTKRFSSNPTKFHTFDQLSQSP